MKGYLVLMIEGIEQDIMVVDNTEDRREKTAKLNILVDMALETSFDVDDMWINYFESDKLINKYNIYNHPLI
ncbi:hypothetical protein phiA047_0178 [Aeromonas phage phiA047]|nr:hypothetical protein phiA047_0178 [Aeromonas phage phiA047]